MSNFTVELEKLKKGVMGLFADFESKFGEALKEVEARAELEIHELAEHFESHASHANESEPASEPVAEVAAVHPAQRHVAPHPAPAVKPGAVAQTNPASAAIRRIFHRGSVAPAAKPAAPAPVAQPSAAPAAVAPAATVAPVAPVAAVAAAPVAPAPVVPAASPKPAGPARRVVHQRITHPPTRRA